MNPLFDYKNAAQLEDLIPLGLKEVRCMICNRRHFPDEETFITFFGNVTVGFSGGVVGNNFNSDGTLGNLQFVCRTEECLNKLTGKLVDNA